MNNNKMKVEKKTLFQVSIILHTSIDKMRECTMVSGLSAPRSAFTTTKSTRAMKLFIHSYFMHDYSGVFVVSELYVQLKSNW